MPKGVYDNAGRRVWTSSEVMDVEEWLALGYSTGEIARRLHRTRTSVETYLKRHQIGIAPRRPMTARAVARVLGRACSKVVAFWISEGWLHARRRGRVWVVSEEALFAFLENPAHWHRWEPESIIDWAIREWATERRAGVRYLTQAEVARRFTVAVGTVSDWLDRRLLPYADTGSHRMVLASALEGFVIPSERSKRGRAHRRFTPLEDARLLSLRASGASWAECGYQLKRDLGSCAGRWHRLQARVRTEAVAA